MKQFLKRFFIFISPLAILCSILFFLPFNKEFAYNFIQGDCYGRAGWIYNRIYKNDDPVDIAFLGSSHVMNAVNDSVLETMLNANTSDTLHVADFGYCRLGINLQYVLLKDILKNKTPQLIVFELREMEDHYSHPMFPYIANTSDIFSAPLFYNRWYVNDIFKAGIARFEYYKNTLEGKAGAFKSGDMKNFGSVYGEDTVNEQLLITKSEERKQVYIEQYYSFKKSGGLNYARGYDKKMFSMLKQKNIPFLFLYLPGYGSEGQPYDYAFYTQYGKILTPPEEILNNKNFWFDEVHMNRPAQNMITAWLSEELKKEFPGQFISPQ